MNELDQELFEAGFTPDRIKYLSFIPLSVIESMLAKLPLSQAATLRLYQLRKEGSH